MTGKPSGNQRKSIIGTIALVLVFLLGLAAFLYPLVSNTLYQAEQKKDMTLYEKSMRELASKKPVARTRKVRGWTRSWKPPANTMRIF